VFAASVFGVVCVLVPGSEACGCADSPLFDRDCGEEEKLCNAGGVAALEVDVATTAEAPATPDCVLCADGLGPVEFCACASNW